MALEYRAVQWNRQKRIYDFVLAGSVGAFLILFGLLSKGIQVSTDPAYNFTSAADRTLVANFITLPGIWISSPAPGTITISWPNAAAGWLLEESPDLDPGSWAESTRLFDIVGTQKQVTITNPTGARYFQLKHP